MSYIPKENCRFCKGKDHVSHFIYGSRILCLVGNKYVVLHILCDFPFKAAFLQDCYVPQDAHPGVV